MDDQAARHAELTKRMDDMKIEFRLELETAHLQLRDIVRDIRESGVSELRTTISKMQKIAHRLAGSSGVFGYEDIGDAASELDNIVLNESCTPVAAVRSCQHLIGLIDEALLAGADEQPERSSIAIKVRARLTRITYVEDEADIREIAEISLSTIGGYEVDVCADGYDAIARSPDFAPDLIILDVMMPGINGVETYKRLRLNPALKHVPVIFMTARIQDDEIAEYHAMGCTDVIAKPFDPMLLPDQIEKIWQQANDNSLASIEARREKCA